MIDIKNITIGVDLDDVLYQTSRMLREMGIAYLKENNIPFKYNPKGYTLEEKFTVSTGIARAVDNACDWANEKYVDLEAVIALQTMQKEYGAKFIIITARNEKFTYRLLQTLYNMAHFQVQGVFCFSTNKCMIANNNQCDVMLDDCVENVISFDDSLRCRPILISPSYITHNKTFANTYKNVLWDWKNLEDTIKQALTTKRQIAVL